MDFLSEGNSAGQNLLRLVARGSAIIAELLRLSEHIPPVFLLGTRLEQEKYGDILFDFRYFDKQEFYEEKLTDSDVMDRDEELRENNIELLERFYRLFESIFKYVKDLNRYMEDLEEGVYIQHRIEDVLMSEDGKQLMSEALYLYGVMLTLMDTRIDGVVRERMLVAYYRYKGSSDILHDVVKLCRQTGFVLNQKRPNNYPEDFFSRIPLPQHIISMVISRLRSDDIYNQTKSFPDPNHRSAALANQASMIFIILYFNPIILHKEASTMREIVDKHFADNWVMPYYMGYVVDLSTMWEGYKAAKTALANTIELGHVREIQQRHIKNMKAMEIEIQKYLTEGVMTDDFILDNINKLLACLRTVNVTIRWLMMHRITKNKKLREVVDQGAAPNDILQLLLHTAEFEFQLKNQFGELLDRKPEMWDEGKKQAHQRMSEMSMYFSGEMPLTRVSKDEQLQAWFSHIAGEVEALQYTDSTLAGRKLHQLVQALEEVEQFHQIETNFSSKHFLEDARRELVKMLRVVNIKESYMVTISVVSDLSYAPEIINGYIGMMHDRIKSNPSNVLRLRATFLKLASYLDLPLVRINQEGSNKDLVSVAQYYSSKLVSYVRKVLEVIPQNVFIILHHIIKMMTVVHKTNGHRLNEVPTRVEKLALKDFAQFDERYQLAQATHKVSVFAEGILAMDTTLVGVIKVEPRQLLEDGIRKELVRIIATALHEKLQFRQDKKTQSHADFEPQLRALQLQLEGFRNSFEYISDYVNLYGLKIWQEEFSRIVNFNVEQECNSFLKKKVYEWQSEYQSEAIPVPIYPPTDDLSVNFIGRLVRELLAQSNPRQTVYLDALSGWYDKSNGQQLIGIRSFSMLNKSISAGGLFGVDKTLAFMIVKALHDFRRWYSKDVLNTLRDYLSTVTESLQPTSALPTDPSRLYATALSRTSKLWPFLTELTAKIGTIQLLRRQISNELNFSSKLDSNILSCSLQVVNHSLLRSIRDHYRKPEEKPYPSDDNPLLEELVKYIDACGMGSPITKIYITTDPPDELPCVIFLFVISQLPKFTYHKALGTLVATGKGKEPLDGTPFVVAVLTLLKQFHSSNIQKFLAYMSQYIRALINKMFTKDQKPTELPSEVINILFFMEEFGKYADMNRKLLEDAVPAYILDRYHS